MAKKNLFEEIKKNVKAMNGASEDARKILNNNLDCYFQLVDVESKPTQKKLAETLTFSEIRGLWADRRFTDEVFFGIGLIKIGDRAEGLTDEIKGVIKALKYIDKYSRFRFDLTLAVADEISNKLTELDGK